MQGLSDLIEVDALNVSGMLLYALGIVWFPEAAYEVVSWAIGACVGISLVVLNVVKIYQYLKDYSGSRRAGRRKKQDEE